MEFSYQDGIVVIKQVIGEEEKKIIDTPMDGKIMYVSSESGADFTPTGLGYWVNEDSEYPAYHATLLTLGTIVGKFPLPTLRLTKRLLEHLYTSDPLIQWTLSREELLQEYGEDRLKDVMSEAWRVTTEDLIGEENGENTLRYLFRNHDQYFQRNLDSEYYERLEGLLDMLAMRRVLAEQKEKKAKAKKNG
jgi:hypothetical protein